MHTDCSALIICFDRRYTEINMLMIWRPHSPLHLSLFDYICTGQSQCVGETEISQCN